MERFRIAHLYPEVFNTGGDRGNVLCLKQRLSWRGFECEVEEIRPGQKSRLADYDLLYIGGGQEFDRASVLESLRGGDDEELRAAIRDGKVVLATCGGYQLMGQYFETRGGDRFRFLGIADFHTVEGKDRLIGNYAFSLPEDLGGGEIVGFENHSGRTYFGNGTGQESGRTEGGATTAVADGADAAADAATTRPLGTVLTGFGNNGEDRTEGARCYNLFCSYAHGPLLPKNPRFADFLLALALAQRGGGADLAPLDDSFETLAHDTVLAATLEGRLGKDA